MPKPIHPNSVETGDYTLTFAGSEIEFLANSYVDGSLHITMAPYAEDLFGATIQVIQGGYERSAYATGTTLQGALDNAVTQWVNVTHDEVAADVAAILAVDAIVMGT